MRCARCRIGAAELQGGFKFFEKKQLWGISFDGVSTGFVRINKFNSGFSLVKPSSFETEQVFNWIPADLVFQVGLLDSGMVFWAVFLQLTREKGTLQTR